MMNVRNVYLEIRSATSFMLTFVSSYLFLTKALESGFCRRLARAAAEVLLVLLTGSVSLPTCVEIQQKRSPRELE